MRNSSYQVAAVTPFFLANATIISQAVLQFVLRLQWRRVVKAASTRHPHSTPKQVTKPSATGRQKWPAPGKELSLHSLGPRTQMSPKGLQRLTRSKRPTLQNIRLKPPKPENLLPPPQSNQCSREEISTSPNNLSVDACVRRATFRLVAQCLAQLRHRVALS